MIGSVTYRLPPFTGEPYEVLLELLTIGGTVAMSVWSETSRETFELALATGELGRVRIIETRTIVLEQE